MGCIKSKPSLTQNDLDFLQNHTSFDAKAIREWHESFIEDCPDGHLTPDIGLDHIQVCTLQLKVNCKLKMNHMKKFGLWLAYKLLALVKSAQIFSYYTIHLYMIHPIAYKMYTLFFTDGNTLHICDEIFKNLDINKKGYINFKEYLLAVDIVNVKTAEETLKAGFRRHAHGGSGELELEKVIKIVVEIIEGVFDRQKYYSIPGCNQYVWNPGSNSASTSKTKLSAEGKAQK